MEKSERFGLVLSPAEKAALQRLANHERLPAAAVVRRLIWREAQQLSTNAPTQDRRAETKEARHA